MDQEQKPNVNVIEAGSIEEAMEIIEEQTGKSIPQEIIQTLNRWCTFNCPICGKELRVPDAAMLTVRVEVSGKNGSIDRIFRTAVCPEHEDRAFKFAMSPLTATMKRTSKQAEADDGDTAAE